MSFSGTAVSILFLNDVTASMSESEEARAGGGWASSKGFVATKILSNWWWASTSIKAALENGKICERIGTHNELRLRNCQGPENSVYPSEMTSGTSILNLCLSRCSENNHQHFKKRCLLLLFSCAALWWTTTLENLFIWKLKVNQHHTLLSTFPELEAMNWWSFPDPLKLR